MKLLNCNEVKTFRVRYITWNGIEKTVELTGATQSQVLCELSRKDQLEEAEHIKNQIVLDEVILKMAAEKLNA